MCAGYTHIYIAHRKLSTESCYSDDHSNIPEEQKSSPGCTHIGRVHMTIEIWNNTKYNMPTAIATFY